MPRIVVGNASVLVKDRNIVGAIRKLRQEIRRRHKPSQLWRFGMGRPPDTGGKGKRRKT